MTVRAGGPGEGIRALRRLREATPTPLPFPPASIPKPAPGEDRRNVVGCDFCSEPIGADGDRRTHRHVVDTEARELRCVCPPCALLFEDAVGGRYRGVGERCLSDPGFTLSDAQWAVLDIPVGLAFFFRNSTVGRLLAFYPGPAGATESLLEPEAFETVLAATPLREALRDDVEALLIRQVGTPPVRQAFLVPIDVCYELVGLLRSHWEGFAGGPVAREHIDALFDRIGAQARPAVKT